ncbi:hypothetical protein ABZ924_34330 [Streptomyces sp. NPDC046876]|uniref:hypothetical protein n=1 Tax=Streptomyces sp. NPDC046876 TaxID=3155616 RepID=UPI003401B919
MPAPPTENRQTSCGNGSLHWPTRLATAVTRSPPGSPPSTPPAAAPLPWGTLQPDRLAERHVGRTLESDPTLADLLLKGADPAQTERLLTVYSRAAAHPVFQGRLDAQLTALCTRHYQLLGEQIIDSATRTDHPAPLTNALNTTIADPATPLIDLETLNGQLPVSSRRLATTAVRLTQTLTNRYRELAEADPGAYLPDLAVSLSNLSTRLGDVGRREEGLAAVEEATSYHRVLAEANPDAYLPALAASLLNLSVCLSQVGRRKEGLAAIKEATGHYRVLAEANPDAYLPDLATSLNNLSNRLGEVGRRGGPGRHRGSDQDPPHAGRGQSQRLPIRPRRVLEQPVQPAE